MITHEWKPGDCAMARGRTVEAPNLSPVKFLVVRHRGDPDYWSAADGIWPSGVTADLCQFSPVLPIEPEDRDQVRKLARESHDRIHKPGDFEALSEMSKDALTDLMQAALRALLTPPKPREPGLYGVVIAGDGREWFRWTTSEQSGRDWCRPTCGNDEETAYARWEDLDVIRVVAS